jgi:hypothetical protein
VPATEQTEAEKAHLQAAYEQTEAEKAHWQAAYARALGEQQRKARYKALPTVDVPIPQPEATYTVGKTDAETAYDKELAKQRVLRKSAELKKQAAKAEAALK